MTLTATQIDLQRRAADLVQREVGYCVSSLVATLAGNGLNGDLDGALGELCDQAFELAAPIADYEEAARESGWKTADLTPGMVVKETPIRFERTGDPDDQCLTAYNWLEACTLDDIEPYDREVFEHWIVSDWLADKLEAKGEKVDRDFAGLTVWARTTTGQAISGDWVIEQITADLHAPAGQ